MNLVKLPLDKTIYFLSGLELFKGFDNKSLNEFALILKPYLIRGGEALIEEGSSDTCIYFLYQGRLRVRKNDEHLSKKKQLFFAEIAPGEFIGEISLLTHLPRTASVDAIRDSIVLRLGEKEFDQFLKWHPHGGLEIAKKALKRSVLKPRLTQAGESIKTLAICPAGRSNHIAFANKLVEKLSKEKSVFLLTEDSCKAYLGKEGLRGGSNEEKSLDLLEWFNSLEEEYDYIIYQTDRELTDWTKRCLRQADKVICLAEHATSPTLNDIEAYLQSTQSCSSPLIEIVFLHPEERNEIVGTHEWLKVRPPTPFYHIKLQSSKLFDRYIRFLTGNAFGVVLNGGGARGFGHTGVLKALDKLEVPVDFVAGVSMGALIGAGYCSHNVDSIAEGAVEFGLNYKLDWTLPLVSLVKGKNVTDFIKKIWKDIQLEDLWIRFFCVSSNLTESKVEVHDRGPVWSAARASMSVPIVLPPIYDKSGNLLVDGGIINNMPVNVMRSMLCGGKILAVNCCDMSGKISNHPYPSPWRSGWRLLWNLLNPFQKKHEEYDSIVQIVLACMGVGFQSQQEEMQKEADYVLTLDTRQYESTDFHAVDKLMEIGYQTAIEQLPKILQIPNNPLKEKTE